MASHCGLWGTDGPCAAGAAGAPSGPRHSGGRRRRPRILRPAGARPGPAPRAAPRSSGPAPPAAAPAAPPPPHPGRRSSRTAPTPQAPTPPPPRRLFRRRRPPPSRGEPERYQRAGGSRRPTTRTLNRPMAPRRRLVARRGAWARPLLCGPQAQRRCAASPLRAGLGASPRARDLTRPGDRR